MTVRSRLVPPLMLVLFTLLAATGLAQIAPPPTPPPGPGTDTTAAEEWEADVQRFEAADRANPPEPGSVVFVGSSTIRMWDSLARDMAPLPVLNRGFGGSEMDDAARLAPRLVLPYRPKAVVLYEGDNDLADEKSPEQVLADFESFLKVVRGGLPQTPVVVISIKPSPSRWYLADQVRATNARLKARCAADPMLHFVDLFTPMLDDTGEPRSGIFLEDRLHMNAAGYAIWGERIRAELVGLVGSGAASRPSRPG